MSSAKLEVLRKELTGAETRNDIPKSIEICRHALANESDLDPDDLLHFGIKLAGYLITYQDPAPETDVDEAIAVLTRLLNIMKTPRGRGRLHLQIGGAIVSRKGDLNEAIKHYEKALEGLTREKDPEEWALAKRAAGEAYYFKGDSISDLGKVVRYYREALTVFTPEQYPDEGLVEEIAMIEDAVAKGKLSDS